MGLIYKWIEGEKNLHDYCAKRFGEKPHFVETIGRVGEAKVELIYKLKEGYGYVPMYLCTCYTCNTPREQYIIWTKQER